MAAYYNEIDPYAAQWLRNLIAAGRIAPGDVDGRDIREVHADDLRGYAQHHFFAGIGGWPLALRMAGWPDTRPVWTGSCPCQPFSAAGKGKGAADDRHLWPYWFRFVRECRPATVFGEQVAAAIGRGWLDAVYADLENEGYACGAAVLPACSVGAPHIRQRLWFVAHAGCGEQPECRDTEQMSIEWNGKARSTGAFSGSGSMGELAHAESQHDGSWRAGAGWWSQPANGRILGHSDGSRSQGRSLDAGEHADQCSPWAAGELVWLPCTDGKARPAKPGIQPLAHGVPGRVGKLRAAGNAIVPQVAAEFIKAAYE
jgi:DNA (cytosine-5)-methyltransferase 1